MRPPRIAAEYLENLFMCSTDMPRFNEAAANRGGIPRQ